MQEERKHHLKKHVILSFWVLFVTVAPVSREILLVSRSKSESYGVRISLSDISLSRFRIRTVDRSTADERCFLNTRTKFSCLLFRVPCSLCSFMSHMNNSAAVNICQLICFTVIDHFETASRLNVKTSPSPNVTFDKVYFQYLSVRDIFDKVHFHYYYT